MKDGKMADSGSKLTVFHKWMLVLMASSKRVLIIIALAFILGVGGLIYLGHGDVFFFILFLPVVGYVLFYYIVALFFHILEIGWERWRSR